jgi:hypothetical protein
VICFQELKRINLMASKQTSIMGPFIVTAIGAVTLGLIVLYFGFYQNRIQTYEIYIAELQSQPTPEISFTFSVSDFSAGQHDSSGNDIESLQEQLQRSGTNSGAENMDPSDVSRSGSETPSTRGSSRGLPQGRTAQMGQSARQAGAARRGSDSAAEDEPVVHRGPAFPGTRRQEDYQADEFDEDYDSDEEPPYIPDINDPELDDNPLIRALREASRRQAENPRDSDYEESPRNPFEEILNRR